MKVASFPATKAGPLNFVLRAFRGLWETDAAVRATIAFLRQARFRGIMFWCGYGHCEPNHVTDAEMKARSRRLREVIPVFKRAGFAVGLNLHTVGFTYSPPDPLDFKFQFQMGPDRAPNRNSVCPLCPRFRVYLDRLLSTFALPGLEYLMVDDDFDYMVPGGKCWCPLHLAAFSRAIGKKMTGERWLKIIDAPGFKPDAMSQAWRAVQVEALLGAARVIERAAHRQEPALRLGPMGINGWVCNRGIEATRRLLEIFRGPARIPPVVRPSVGAYWDWQRGCAHGASSHSSEIFLRTLLPPDATAYLELDSGAPWTIFDHGAEHLRYLAERSIATGSRDFAWLLFPDGPGDTVPRDHPYTVMLKRGCQRFEALASLVGENPAFEGVDSRTGENYDLDPRHDHFFGIASFALARIGLALAPTGEWVTVLSGKQPWTIGAERIAGYLGQGALLDAGAIESLRQMGAGAILGDATVTSWTGRTPAALHGALSAPGAPVGLVMSDHPLNGAAAGRHFSNLGGLRKQCRQFIGDFRTQDVLSWWVNPAFKRLGPAEVAIESGGRRLILLAYPLTGQTPDAQILVANPLRQQMFHNACEWLAWRPLPAVIKDGADVHLFCMRSPDGRRKILTLVNNGFNRFDQLTLEVAALPSARVAVRTVDAQGVIQPVRALTMKRLKGRWRIRLPAGLTPGPMEVRVLAFE